MAKFAILDTNLNKPEFRLKIKQLAIFLVELNNLRANSKFSAVYRIKRLQPILRTPLLN